MATKSNTTAAKNANVNANVYNGARTPEQVAALAAMREAKNNPPVETPEVVEPVIAESAPAENIVDQAARMQAMVQDAVMKFLGFGDDNPDAPSWKRKLAAFFSSVVLATGAGTAIGWLAGNAVVGIATLGGSVLWSYLILLVGMIASVYAGAKIAQYVGNYVLSGQVDKDIVRAKDTVLGWFGKAKAAITTKSKITATA